MVVIFFINRTFPSILLIYDQLKMNGTSYPVKFPNLIDFAKPYAYTYFIHTYIKYCFNVSIVFLTNTFL